MSGTLQFLNVLVEHQLAKGLLRGALHVVIGRTVVRTADSTVLCAGISWRELALLLKKSNFDRNLARDFGADPDTLHPKDREKFWYSVIGMARVDSTAAREEADTLAKLIVPYGLHIEPPGGAASKLAELAPTLPKLDGETDNAQSTAKPKPARRT